MKLRGTLKSIKKKLKADSVRLRPSNSSTALMIILTWTNKNNYLLLHDIYIPFQEQYYEKEERNSSRLVFKLTTPVVVVDTSKQNDEITAYTVDVRVEIDALEKPTNISAHYILIHDCIVEYVSITRKVRKI